MCKRIAIIGAGLTGIGCLTELVNADYKVRLYERNDDIGGVWHPENCYSGLSLHGASATFEYHDFPLPQSVDKARPISAREVYEYLKAYFSHKSFYNYAEFNTEVEKISYSRSSRVYTLHMRKRGTNEAREEQFDYVIYTHGFSARTVPSIPNSASFAGKIFHSFDLTDSKLNDLVEARKNVVLIGGSKTATDLILRFNRHGYRVRWLCRKNYWFLRSEPLIAITEARMAGTSWGGYRRLGMFIGSVVGGKSPRLHLAIWRACGLLDTYGARHWDFRKFHWGRIGDNAMSTLRQYFKGHGLIGEIKSFFKDGITLEDGKNIECDTVVFCTGSSPHKTLLSIELDDEVFDLAGVTRMYRERVIPELPGLIFTAFHVFTFGVVNGLVTGKWVLRYIQGGYGETYLHDHSKMYDPPFFSRPSFLFDSSRPTNVRSAEVLTEFFESGEISTRDYLRWLWSITSAPSGVLPLEINAPTEFK